MNIRPRFKSLQQRLSLLMLLPVGILLFIAGSAGFFYARKNLLEQWQQTAILELQRQAHLVDMMLDRPKQWIDKLSDNAIEGRRGAPHILGWVLEQLRQTEGVVRVDLQGLSQETSSLDAMSGMMMRSGRMAEGGAFDANSSMPFHKGLFREITPPRYDPRVEFETISMVSDLIDESGHPVARMTTVIRFDYLFRDVKESKLWRDYDAFLVDEGGNILYHSTAGSMRSGPSNTESAIDSAIIETIRTLPYGTVMSDGRPPERISGFYHLKEAPWTLVISAPGYELLAPIHHFGLLYILCGAAIIALVLFLIRSVTGKSVAAIRKISSAAEGIAGGRLDVELPVGSADEIGELTRSFNAMTHQLKEREQLKQAMNLAMEVQQNFLPRKTLRFDGLEIAGRSIYCDETGGDYYDFIQFPEWPSGSIGIAVGDVVGHGISAALLMATTRALLRSRAARPGSLAEIISDTNRHLSIDNKDSGNFVTLFYALIDSKQRSIRWVRAGHDPAILYDPLSDTFQELQGKGIALGVDEQAMFLEDQIVGFVDGQILLIGTDGVWEAENKDGQRFGKENLIRVIKQCRHDTAERILENVEKAIDRFRQGQRIQDDITMVVVRLGGAVEPVDAFDGITPSGGS
jgi:sigma-B regulation protein RsbU (phosphoserine phosphatase)